MMCVCSTAVKDLIRNFDEFVVFLLSLAFFAYQVNFDVSLVLLFSINALTVVDLCLSTHLIKYDNFYAFSLATVVLEVLFTVAQFVLPTVFRLSVVNAIFIIMTLASLIIDLHWLIVLWGYDLEHSGLVTLMDPQTFFWRRVRRLLQDMLVVLSVVMNAFAFAIFKQGALYQDPVFYTLVALFILELAVFTTIVLYSAKRFGRRLCICCVQHDDNLLFVFVLFSVSVVALVFSVINLVNLLYGSLRDFDEYRVALISKSVVSGLCLAAYFYVNYQKRKEVFAALRDETVEKEDGSKVKYNIEVLLGVSGKPKETVLAYAEEAKDPAQRA
mmetsp:Transcript_14739/g.55784  ORF Transcript_14739/g.55784 Transcript_14739/m.55784 type:complete len:329 (-) Transcript_14739:172-1158(-)